MSDSATIKKTIEQIQLENRELKVRIRNFQLKYHLEELQRIARSKSPQQASEHIPKSSKRDANPAWVSDGIRVHASQDDNTSSSSDDVSSSSSSSDARKKQMTDADRLRMNEIFAIRLSQQQNNGWGSAPTESTSSSSASTSSSSASTSSSSASTSSGSASAPSSSASAPSCSASASSNVWDIWGTARPSFSKK